MASIKIFSLFVSIDREEYHNTNDDEHLYDKDSEGDGASYFLGWPAVLANYVHDLAISRYSDNCNTSLLCRWLLSLLWLWTCHGVRRVDLVALFPVVVISRRLLPARMTMLLLLLLRHLPSCSTLALVTVRRRHLLLARLHHLAVVRSNDSCWRHDRVPSSSSRGITGWLAAFCCLVFFLQLIVFYEICPVRHSQQLMSSWQTYTISTNYSH